MSAARTGRGMAWLALGALAACESIVQLDDKHKPENAAASSSSASATANGSGAAASSSSVASSGSGGTIIASHAPGCSDGSREGFGDPKKFSQIAGCSAVFSPGPKGMRSPPTGKACGNDLGDCAVAADACQNGWHVCMRNGYAFDLTSRIAPEDCGPATELTPKFHAATELKAQFYGGSSQQVPNVMGGCTIPMPCNPNDGGYAIAICCGKGCYISQSSCAFGDQQTPFNGGPCAQLGNGDLNHGVLCCQDPELK